MQAVATRVLASLVAGLPVSQPIRWVPASVFKGWDGDLYAHLAGTFDGWAWPPLYPLLLRVGLLVGGTSGIELAALGVNLLSHAAIVFLASALLRSTPSLAHVPGWLFAALLLFFPGHNVFFAMYSESLFLALGLGACVAWKRERRLLAGVLCGLSCWTRTMGVFLGAALLAAELWRNRSLLWRHRGRIAQVGAWIPFVAAWSAAVYLWGHTDPVHATAGWQQELLAQHVPVGMSARLWVLEYLALPGHREFLFFWASAGVAVLCWRRGLVLEALFVALFLLSHAVYLYRPFPFTRYASVLFPLPLMLAAAVSRHPRLQVLAVSLSLLVSLQCEALLFMGRMGEP